jgi:hypothetical protein
MQELMMVINVEVFEGVDEEDEEVQKLLFDF